MAQKVATARKNEIVTRDNLPRPNCNSDGKADNKQQAFINTDTRHFRIQTGDVGPPPTPLAGPLNDHLSAKSIIFTSILQS